MNTPKTPAANRVVLHCVSDQTMPPCYGRARGVITLSVTFAVYVRNEVAGSLGFECDSEGILGTFLDNECGQAGSLKSFAAMIGVGRGTAKKMIDDAVKIASAEYDALLADYASGSANPEANRAENAAAFREFYNTAVGQNLYAYRPR